MMLLIKKLNWLKFLAFFKLKLLNFSANLSWNDVESTVLWSVVVFVFCWASVCVYMHVCVFNMFNM